ncbi:MAG: putative phage integrase [Phenylobacterium sp.]|nr:putative phage integrase [Phenylobacterium sp.]
MAIHKLTDTKIKALIRAGKRRAHSDGNNLYLHVAGANDRASWVFRYMIEGAARTMGLGPYPDVSLEEARDKARLQRKVKIDGADPLDARRLEKASRAAEQQTAMTFRECAVAYIKAHAPSWRNPKHAAQWPASLGTYVYPVFGDLPVGDVDTPLVLAVLRQDIEVGGTPRPLWEARTETATRVRQRIEAVLDWARVGGFRSGDNPARWGGHLEHQLPPRGKVSKVKNHARLEPKAEIIADFMTALRSREGVGALALEFTILTAARTGEVIGAKWGEIDLDAKVWTVPSERMKAGREHRVPLSDAAVAVLEKVKPGRTSASPETFVFPGQGKGEPLSNMAMAALLQRRMGFADITVHGFRSTFRDWVGETTSTPADVVEMALAHTIKNKVEAAYRRSDLLERRRDLMSAWASACSGPAGGNVAVLKAAVAA